MIAVYTITPLQAQKLIKKELQTENNDKDGFQYQWNKYTYVLGKDTLEAAYDKNGKRITPNGYRKGRGYPGIRYTGGGRFQVKSKKEDAFGNLLISGYNVKGECVLPETIYTYMFYEGDGLFSLTTHDELGKMMVGLYDYKGNCIIPESKGFIYFYLGYEDFIKGEIDDNHAALFDLNGKCIIPETKGFNFFSFRDDFIFCENFTNGKNAVYDLLGNCIISEALGYTWIAYYPKYEFFWCDKGDIEHTISKDGRYYAEGHYSAGNDNKKEFERKKRQVPNWNKNSMSTGSSSSSSNSSSSSTASNTESGLLYEGDYTEGPWTNPNTGYSQPAPMPNHHIKIYEDHIIIDMVSLPYQGKSINGEKMYVNSWSNITYYVDGFYNIRSTFPYGYSQFSKGNVVFDMNAPVQGGYDNNNNNSYGTTPQKHEHGTREVTIDCPICHTTGNCQSCNGSGVIYFPNKHECGTCKGNKKCWKCNGTGRITKTERY